MTDARVDRLVVQELVQGNPQARVDRLVVQELVQGNPQARVDRLVVQALVGPGLPDCDPPPNDNVADAVDFSGSSGVFVGNICGATLEAGEHTGYFAGYSVWYRYEPATDGTLSLDMTGTTFDSRLGVYVGGIDEASLWAESPDPTLDVAVVSGTVFLIRVDVESGTFDPSDPSEFTLAWSGPAVVEPPPPPPEPPACPTYTVWYSWVAPGDGLGSFHAVGGAGGTHPSDPTLSVQLDAFTGPDLAGLEPVGTGGDTVNFLVLEGETYYIRVNSVNAFEFGPFTLEWVFTEESLPAPAPRVLGCSQHVAYIQSKCNGARLCELLDASALGYDRRLDDISEAFVEIPISGDADEACCACLKDVEPWCHVLTIVREGDGVVWTGPVQKVTYGYEKVRIEAKDKLAWLQVRVNELTIDEYKDNTTVSMTTIAKDICEVAMDDDGDSPCFMDCVEDLGDGYAPGVERKFIFEAFEGPTAYDDFSSLGQAGIDFTVINQCLILTSEQLPDAAIGTLLDEHIVGDISVVKDGATFGNRFFVRYEGDDNCPEVCAPQAAAAIPPIPCPPPDYPCCPCPAVADVPEEEQGCYGSVERLIPNDLGLQSKGSAEVSAEAFLNASKSGSRRIEFPDGTQLSPDTPWLINDMIPGQRIDVALSKTCFPVYQSFKLQHVSVEDDLDGERISIDLKALNQTP